MASKINNLEDVKKILSEKDLSFSLNKILKSKKENLSKIKLLQEALTDNKIIEKIKNENDISQKKEVKLFVYSKMMSILSFYNKKSVLDEFFLSLSEKEIKKIATYEYKNKTDITINNDIFDKYCLKYKINFLSFPNEAEILELTQRINVINEKKKEEENKKKNKNKEIKEETKKTNKKVKTILVIIFLILFLSFIGYTSYRYIKLNSKYKNLIYPGVYVNDINLSGKTKENVKRKLEEEKNMILDKKIVFSNVNGDYEYTLKDLNVSLDNDKMYKEVIGYNNNLSFFRKIKILIKKLLILFLLMMMMELMLLLKI